MCGGVPRGGGGGGGAQTARVYRVVLEKEEFVRRFGPAVSRRASVRFRFGSPFS